MLARVLGLCLALQFQAMKPVTTWTDEELAKFLSDSPWARQALAADSSEGVQVYLASARPVREVEVELARRAAAKQPGEQTGEDEYREFVRENAGRYIVLAVAYPDPKRLEDAAERKHFEQECVLKVGRKKFRMTGHFPPSAGDPWLRLVFPRAVSAADRSFRFDLYLPGIASPYREAEFRVKELYYRGELEL